MLNMSLSLFCFAVFLFIAVPRLFLWVNLKGPTPLQRHRSIRLFPHSSFILFICSTRQLITSDTFSTPLTEITLLSCRFANLNLIPMPQKKGTKKTCSVFIEPKCQNGFFNNYRNLSFSRILKSHSSVAVQFPMQQQPRHQHPRSGGQVSKPLSAALTVYNDASIRSA